jgi:L-ascorbate oxidase
MDPTLPHCDEGCTMENYVAPISVEPQRTYLFRIINGAGLVPLNFAIAGHNMTVVGADGQYVVPFETSSLDVNVAQRYAVLVSTDQEPMSYWATAHTFGATGYTYLQYGNSTPPDENYTMPVHIEDGPGMDAMLVSKDVSAHPNSEILAADVIPDRSIVFVSAQGMHTDSGLNKYTGNNVSNSMHTPKPVAYLAYTAVMEEDAAPWPDTKIPGTMVVPDLPEQTWNYSNPPQVEGINTAHDQHGIAIYKFVKGDIVEMVLQNVMGSRRAAAHAWHLHGHEVYVIGQGVGAFDPERDPVNFNLENPVLRDTFSTWELGWTAIRFRANNAGAWPFHCTMAPHAVTGMGFNVITSPDMLTAPPPGLTSCFQTSMNPADAQVCTPMIETMMDDMPAGEANGTVITVIDVEDGTDVPISRDGDERSLTEDDASQVRDSKSDGAMEACHGFALAVAKAFVAGEVLGGLMG